MIPNFAALPDAPTYRLANAAVPPGLSGEPGAGGELTRLDIVVAEGEILAVSPAGAVAADLPTLDLQGGIVLPAFVDIHTHLDKGHILPRQTNPDGTFAGALGAVAADRAAHWSAADVARRMEFSLRAAYAHGTRAIRTHLDSIAPQHRISFPVFSEMRARWAGRIDLQAVALVGGDYVFDEAMMADVVAVAREHGARLGGAFADGPRAREQVETVVRLAAENGLDLDLHIDETLNPAATCFRFLADAVIGFGFSGQVVAGHCCSIARQDEATADATLDRVAEAGIAVVSLPMCNLYLQDRVPGRTPRWRGVTLVHEMAARGIDVAVASDNTRDPFYAYGDLDMAEVYREATRILHLDHPVGDWPRTVTRTPARLMGLEPAEIATGAPADLVLFRARRFDELLARPQDDRVVVRAGRAVDRTLPTYEELDDLFGR